MKLLKKFAFLLFTTALFLGCDSDEKIDDLFDNNDSKADIEWSANLSKTISAALFRTSPAIDENDNIYILQKEYVGEGFTIDAFNKNGEKRWSKTNTTDVLLESQLTYYDGKLFVHCHDNRIICFNAENGDVIWNKRVTDSYNHARNFTIANNMLIYRADKTLTEYEWHLFALDISSGDVNYELDLTQFRENEEDEDRKHAFFEQSTLAANGNMVYFADDIHLFAIEATSSAFIVKWNSNLPDDVDLFHSYGTSGHQNNKIAIAPNGKIIVQYNVAVENLYDYKTAVYSPDGTLLWTHYYENNNGSITTDAQSNVYMGGASLLKLNGSNGSTSWTANPPLFIGSITNQVKGKDGRIYASDFFGVYIVNNSGSVVSNMSAGANTDSQPFSNLSLLSNGNIVVIAQGIDSGQIFCFKSSSEGVAKNIWAKREGNAKNTFNLKH
ncbi:outer membrane protein assembly factor BamB family protein [Alkalitalea saponilacus]|uniref:Outer membrane protein assembly factor BamB, contains PQQ-like beta-propeller repeat n=1 Tax=Alkalitalea saponilacus TaxID=889453 RepID=A0A1T5BVE9_9BACT|nr:PQQ-binding-like beta-propeller repeat protein [Alkalitalea saponilacus]ASB49592.1 hypothetical protein CDL62_10785 [Alkalitalea saponilacus]SKB50840.1 Outer membrane protein assembly factor BamB, contains PQQ-like beta-propeller repeat [Alkalitalea saponilacus]